MATKTLAAKATVEQPRPGRRERRRLETRELIFRAALRLFAERGFAGTTVEDITEAADVGKGTFFNYFPSKEHILAAFGELQMSKVQASLAGVLAGRETMQVALRRLVQKIAEEPGRSPTLARSMVGAFLTNEEVRRFMATRQQQGLVLLESAIAAAQQRGEVRQDAVPARIARHILQSYFGTVMMWTVFADGSLASTLESSFELLWAGVAASPNARHKERTS